MLDATTASTRTKSAIAIAPIKDDSRAFSPFDTCALGFITASAAWSAVRKGWSERVSERAGSKSIGESTGSSAERGAAGARVSSKADAAPTLEASPAGKGAEASSTSSHRRPNSPWLLVLRAEIAPPKSNSKIENGDNGKENIQKYPFQVNCTPLHVST